MDTPHDMPVALEVFQRRLLLVDDEPLVLAAFSLGLRACGYEVVAAVDGHSALACAAESVFDLAILDIQMPGMSGLDLGRQLRARHDLDSIYLTAHSQPEFVSRAVEGGALTYLVKPIGVSQLVPAVSAACARARELRTLAHRTEHLNRALTGGRNTSVLIGMLMERHGWSEQTCFEVLRLEARKQRLKLEAFCEDLLAGPRPVAFQGLAIPKPLNGVGS